VVSYDPAQRRVKQVFMARESSGLSRVGELVRRHDPDRFFTALFAPPEKREALLTLYAFNHELARAREAVREPWLALVRLQWWREVAEGVRRSHEVAEPLSDAISSGALDRADLLGMVEAREAEAEPQIASLQDWLAYLHGTAGGVMVAAGRALGASEPEELRPLGAAYGAAGVLRSVEFAARHGRCLLPADVLEAHGLSPAGVIAAPDGAAVRKVRLALAAEGRRLLNRGRGARLSRSALAAALPAVLARRDLRRDGAARRHGASDRLAVVWAWLTGRFV
jgi:phytoene synthase